MSDRMKKIFSFGLPFVSCVIAVFFLLPSCGDNEEIVQRKSEKSYSVDEGKNQLVVEIPCRKAWSLSGAAEWCVPATTEGRGKTSITVNIAPNGAEESRSCTMQAVSEDTRHTITITQYGAETIVLPVVFHVLYNDRNDSLQYIEAGRLADFLEAANLCYAGEYGGAELNVQFALATDSPDGEKLAVPGVEYLQRDEYEIDCEVFMTDNSGKYAALLWDPNRYINVFMYQFASGETADGVTLGISHFPYTPIDAYLEGTNLTNYPYITLSNLMYPYSISLNSKCAYESYILMTLSHELGHYLGLRHVFSEGDSESVCIDSDYCEDTPSYNREDYLRYMAWAGGNLSPEEYVAVRILREGCSGEQFVSVNVMDYNYGDQNRFTADQRSRVRHILRNSPLIPTERNARIQRSMLHDGPIDLPIVTMK